MHQRGQGVYWWPLAHSYLTLRSGTGAPTEDWQDPSSPHPNETAYPYAVTANVLRTTWLIRQSIPEITTDNW